jgi:hypothetical protein
VKDRGYAPPTIAELERLFAGEYEKFRAQNPRSGNRPVVTVHHPLNWKMGSLTRPHSIYW